MLDFISFLADIFETALTAINNLLAGLVQFVMLIPQAITFLTSSIAYIPAEIAIFVSIALVIPVVFLILGR